MRLSRYIHKLVWMLPAAVMFAACSDDNEPFAPSGEEDAEGQVPSELTLTLSIPDPEVVELGSRASDSEPAISSLTVFCYDKSGAHLSHAAAPAGSWVGGKYQVTVPLHKRTYSIQLVANATVGASETNPATILSDAANVLWGKTDIKDVLAVGSQLTMLRNSAKVSVTNGAGVNFAFTSFGVTGTSTKGTVAPAAANYNASTHKVSAPSLPASNAFTSTTDARSTSDVYVFETPADQTVSSGVFRTQGRIIIKGYYNSAVTPSYYVVAFRTRSGSGNSEIPGAYTYTPIPVLRNHHYTVHITEVRSEGWGTLAEALQAEPDNRMTVLITDKTDEVTDIIANRDYMLGVSDELSLAYDDPYATISIVTTYPDAKAGDIKYTADESWLRVSDTRTTIEAGSTQSGATGGVNSTSRSFDLSIALDANDGSTSPRSGNVTITVGDLSRTVKVTQAGRDYKRDPNRKITVTGIPGLTCTDWFSFVDNTCRGLLPAENRNVIRNEGLHFPAVPAYTVSYSIPKLTGDKSAVVASGDFTVTTSGNNYIVTARTPSTAGISTGKLRITNAAGAAIEYDLYKTGYIHQLTSATDTYQREGGAINGWFYYEVVKLSNGSYILDRNLGASSNAPYISTYAGFTDQEGAKGAYFKIAVTKPTSTPSEVVNNVTYTNTDQTIIRSLSVSNFNIPTKPQVMGWGVTTTNVSGTNGETATVATISTTGSLVKDNKVYLSHSGYYEGESAKYETHANIWTRTLVAGNQGFSQGSPEFGYWFQYLDVYTSKVNYSNMRFANGTAGAPPSETSVFKYMPIRLVWQ